ncbi:MAG: acyl carrier protein [Myxococcaceae bacterium]|nr:acyl carrier protein [Myxococcaceae bacterium]
MRSGLRTFISDTFFVQDFKDSDSFLTNRLIDSTGMMEVVAHLEEVHGVKVKDDELVPANLDSIDNLVAFIARKKG